MVELDDEEDDDQLDDGDVESTQPTDLHGKFAYGFECNKYIGVFRTFSLILLLDFMIPISPTVLHKDLHKYTFSLYKSNIHRSNLLDLFRKTVDSDASTNDLKAYISSMKAPNFIPGTFEISLLSLQYTVLINVSFVDFNDTTTRLGHTVEPGAVATDCSDFRTDVEVFPLFDVSTTKPCVVLRCDLLRCDDIPQFLFVSSRSSLQIESLHTKALRTAIKRLTTALQKAKPLLSTAVLLDRIQAACRQSISAYHTAYQRAWSKKSLPRASPVARIRARKRPSSTRPFFSRSKIKTEMESFRADMQKLTAQVCGTCHNLSIVPAMYLRGECTSCSRESGIPKFSIANDMIPCEVPPELKDIRPIEEMMISRCVPLMHAYYKPGGGQRGYSGNSISIPQNTSEIAAHLQKLPRRVEELPIVHIRRFGNGENFKDSKVRRTKVTDAITWLQANNPHYKDITIDYDYLGTLPDDGLPEGLNLLNETQPDTIDGHEYVDRDDECEDEGTARSFLSSGDDVPLHKDVLRCIAEGKQPFGTRDNPIPCKLADQPMNEFTSVGMISKCFPTLCPDGSGDFTNPRDRKVSLTETVKHYARFVDVQKDGSYRARFSSHPTFSFWLFNRWMRHSLITQTNVYASRHTKVANMTRGQLETELSRGKKSSVFKGLHVYQANFRGTTGYWFREGQNLLAAVEQLSPPTFFWSLSLADYQINELQKFMPWPAGTRLDKLDYKQKKRMVRENPQIAAEYFYLREASASTCIISLMPNGTGAV